MACQLFKPFKFGGVVYARRKNFTGNKAGTVFLRIFAAKLSPLFWKWVLPPRCYQSKLGEVLAFFVTRLLLDRVNTPRKVLIIKS